MAVPQQCSLLLVKDKDILHRCHSRGAEYLFQKDKYYDKSYDPGDKYLQCGRKCDVYKFWLMWKAKVGVGELQCDNPHKSGNYKCAFINVKNMRNYFHSFIILP